MQLVLGVRGIPRGEVDLLRSILRLSSNLQSRWTVSENLSGDLLLVEGTLAGVGIEPPSADVMVVPLVARHESPTQTTPVLLRPIYAEELVKLLNDVGTMVARARPRVVAADQRGNLARLKRWPSQPNVLQHPNFIRLATALTRGTHSSASLSTLTGIEAAECARFLELLDREGLIRWQHGAPATPQPASGFLDTQPDGSARTGAKQGLMSRIRRRLGLA